MQIFQHLMPREKHRRLRQFRSHDLRELLFKPVFKAAHRTCAGKFSGLQTTHSIAYHQKRDRLLSKARYPRTEAVLIR